MIDSAISISTIDYEIVRLAARRSIEYSRLKDALLVRHHLTDDVDRMIMTTLAEVFVGRREMSREEVKGEKEVEVMVDYPASLWHLLLYTIPFTRRFAKMKAKPVAIKVDYAAETITNYYVDPLIERHFDCYGQWRGGSSYRIVSINNRLTADGCEIERERMDNLVTNGYTSLHERTSG